MLLTFTSKVPALLAGTLLENECTQEFGRGTGKALEGAGRQTDRRSVHYSKMTNKLCSVCNYFVFVSDLQYFLIWLHTFLGLLITILEP